MSLQAMLEGHDRIFVRQRREWVEILSGWESRNQYALLDAEGGALGTLAEGGGGLGALLRRTLLRSHRPLEVLVADAGGAPVLRLTRPFFLLFSDLRVEEASGRLVGRVRRRFGLLRRRYDLEDDTERTFATVQGPRWRPWTFRIHAGDAGPVARVTKRWGGGLRELFTDADAFLVELGDHPWTTDHRAVLLAAAISIDLDFFENSR